MGRLVLLALAAFGAWKLLGRRSRPDERITVGYADGSALVLEDASPERDRLAALAGELTRP